MISQYNKVLDYLKWLKNAYYNAVVSDWAALNICQHQLHDWCPQTVCEGIINTYRKLKMQGYSYL